MHARWGQPGATHGNGHSIEHAPNAAGGGQPSGRAGVKQGILDCIASKATLRQLAHKRLRGCKLVLASTREPYVHRRSSGGINWYRAAGGLTLALDSLAAACEATWVCPAAGSWDEGTTVSRPRRLAPPGTRCLFAGDDTTDERAFRSLAGEGGCFTYKVGPGTTLADHHGDRRGLLQWLLRLRSHAPAPQEGYDPVD